VFARPANVRVLADLQKQIEFLGKDRIVVLELEPEEWKRFDGSGRSWPRRTRSSLVTLNAVPLRPAAMTNPQYGYEIRSRKDCRGVDLISDVLPFGRLCYHNPENSR
jgi:hypothetical protein